MKSVLGNLQQQIEAAKKQLDFVFVESESEDKIFKIKVSANKSIESITVDEALLKAASAEAIQASLKATLNELLAEAERKAANELKRVATGLLPDLPKVED